MFVVLHNIRSMHNVGSIFRTADAVGVNKIYLTGFTPQPLDRLGIWRSQILKVSLGAEKSVPWEKVYSTPRLLKNFRQDKFRLLALEQNPRSIPYFRVKLTEKQYAKTVFLLGNEKGGLPSSLLRLADQILEIPMFGRKESLNVAVAFGIVAYHLRPGKF